MGVRADAPDDGALDEARFVKALASGEPSALRTAYRLHAAHIRAFARRFLGDDAAAEDLVHEVFVALPRAISGWRRDCALRTFLVAIAANTSRKALRSAIRRRQAMGRFALEPTATVSPDAAPDASLERRRLADALARALDDLPHDQRVAFVLCEVEERSSPEVALIVGAPEGTVRTRLHHAKLKLRASLDLGGFR